MPFSTEPSASPPSSLPPFPQGIYAANVAKIEQHNAGGHGWTMEVNQFADLTAQEFGAQMINGAGGLGGYRSNRRNGNSSPVAPSGNPSRRLDLPSSVDWNAAGAVTPVKSQGQCGADYAFSATGAIEGVNFIYTNTLVSLSEQQLVSCSGDQGNAGCNGGMMEQAFQFVIDNGGICTEDAYPYTAAQGTCQTTCQAAATIDGFQDVPANSETALVTAISEQPVSVAIEADQSSFQFYSSGVMTAACGTQLDHGVLAAGYGTLSGQDYYYVKNSWGADWGANGFILLGRGESFGATGQCGIHMAASYPTKISSES